MSERRKHDRNDGSRVFPHSIESEQALLGAMIIDETARRDAIGTVQTGDFYRGDHRALFMLMLDMTARSQPVDLVTLSERVAQTDDDGHYGGVSYVLSLPDHAPSASNARHYAEIIRDKAMRRRMIALLQEVQESTWSDPHASLFDLRDKLVGSLLGMEATAERRGWKTYAQVGRELLDHVLNTDPNHPRGISSGFDRLDVTTGRMQPGEMIVVCARPAMGKSAFALDVIEHVARTAGPVALFSLEMSDRQMFARSITKQMVTSVRALMEGNIPDDTISDLENVVERLADLPVFVDEQAGLTVPEIRARTQSLLAMHPDVRLVVIDYLQIISAENTRAPVHEQIAAISAGLKRMAKDLKIPVLVLSQLNRQGANREDPRPTLVDMAGSDAIVKDADRVLGLHRPRYYWPSNEKIPADLAELHVLKCRNGIPGPINIRWDGSRTQFTNAVSR